MKRFFFYNYRGHKVNSYSSFHVVLISEGELPPFSKKYEGRCAFFSKDIPRKILVGSIIDIAFGDPRIMKKCKFISWNLEGVPSEMVTYIKDGITLEYHGKKIWANRKYLCLERDLKK